MSEAAETENPARYALFKALFLHSEGRSQFEAHQLIDAFAHELAEEIRGERDDMDIPGSPATPDVINAMSYAANLIDPQGHDGKRPDEEPTT